MVNYYPLISRWNTAADEERGPFKDAIRRIVGYDCKIACEPNDGVVDIYVLSGATGKVKDILAMSPNGGLAIVKEDDSLSTNPECAAFNAANGVEYDSDSGSDSGSGSGSDSEESEDSE